MVLYVCLTVGGGNMAVLETILSVILVVLGIAISVIILMQEGKSAGLGAISGAAESYWGRNKGRSMEGTLEKFTKWGCIIFLILALVINILY